MGRYDFVIPHDAEKYGERIIQNIIVGRLKYNKPVILFLSGDSGEGKSFTGLRIIEIINKYYGVKTDVEKQIVYTPLEYGQKLDAILHDKALKKYRVIMVDEAREVIKAKLWFSFINQAISDINALMRSVKPIALIINSQSIRDIDKDVRFTLTYYGECFRPLGNRTRLKLYRMWKDTRDIESVKLRKRRITGYVRQPSGKYKKLTPKYFEMNRPDKELADKYDELNKQAKTTIIKRKFAELMQKIREEVGEPSQKVEELVKWYVAHPENINLVLEKKRGKLKLNKNVELIHSLTKEEKKEFQEKLLRELVKSSGGDVGAKQ